MWLSSKKYDKLWERAYGLQKDKDLLIRILSGVIIAQGGKVIIPNPSADSRSLIWKTDENGQVTIESKIINIDSGEMIT